MIQWAMSLQNRIPGARYGHTNMMQKDLRNGVSYEKVSQKKQLSINKKITFFLAGGYRLFQW